MSEFRNRMDAQRKILQLVNSKRGQNEELFGLSSKAIERWAGANVLDPNSNLVSLVKQVSGKLFFLANKCQEQISEDYRIASRDIDKLIRSIEDELRLQPLPR